MGGGIKHQERYHFSYFYNVMRKEVKLCNYVLQAGFMVIAVDSDGRKD